MKSGFFPKLVLGKKSSSLQKLFISYIQISGILNKDTTGGCILLY